MKRLLGLAACLVVLVPAIAMAQDAYTYWGPHPVHPAAGSGYCYAEGTHAHPYGTDPNISYLYRVYNNQYFFVGNVYHFGYQRQAFPYYGHHPLAAELGGSFCYLDGVHYLRTLGDSDALRQRLDAGGRVAVIGGGWIGSEFAASARQKGLEVALIDPLEIPMARLFGEEVGSFYRDVHAQHGVELLCRAFVDAVTAQVRRFACRLVARHPLRQAPVTDSVKRVLPRGGRALFHVPPRS